MPRQVLDTMEGVNGGCVQRSDTKNMPKLLDHVSDVRENEASRHFAISLYGELAQAHKQAIIPYIPRMMASIVRSLPFSADSHQLHEACAKAVASMARYTIDPTRPYDSNQQILYNLCSPLLPVLASKLESSAAGGAICLQALVESEKWKFAHPDLQGVICSKATAALSGRGAHTVAFLHLVKSLAKFSRDASQCYVAEWVRIGLQVLQTDSGLPGSWQQRVVAAQVISIVLKITEVDKLDLDLRTTTKILEAYLMDKVTVVHIAVAEALETIKGLALEKRMHHDSADSGCESKRRNSDVEESGLQELSGSVSPTSDTSSHEAVPSMASATVKFGMGSTRLNQRASDSLRLSSHASLNLPRPAKQKDRTPATVPRRVLSETPASGKFLSNAEVLPSSCPPEAISRSSVDLGNKVGNSLMQDKCSFGSEKSTECAHNQTLDFAKKTSSPVEKHVEGCLNFSNMGCMCTLSKEEDRCNNQLANPDQLAGKADSEVFDDCVEEDMHILPINSLCRKFSMNDDCTAGVLTSDCTGDSLSRADASKDASTESLTIVETESHIQVEKPHALTEDFTFRAPCSLLHSLQSNSSTAMRKKSFKKGTDPYSCIPKEASKMGSADFSSSESEESHAIATDYESRHETSDASCGTSDVASSSGDRLLKSGSHAQRRSLQKINDQDGGRLSAECNKCEIHASGYDWPSSRDTSDSAFDNDMKTEGRKNVNLHRRSSKKSGSRKRFTAQKEALTKLSAGPDPKSRGLDQSGEEIVLAEVFKKQICARTFLCLVCAVGILVLAVMVTQHVNRIYDSHALVPT